MIANYGRMCLAFNVSTPNSSFLTPPSILKGLL